MKKQIERLDHELISSISVLLAELIYPQLLTIDPIRDLIPIRPQEFFANRTQKVETESSTIKPQVVNQSDTKKYKCVQLPVSYVHL